MLAASTIIEIRQIGEAARRVPIVRAVEESGGRAHDDDNCTTRRAAAQQPDVDAHAKTVGATNADVNDECDRAPESARINDDDDQRARDKAAHDDEQRPDDSQRR